MRVGLAALSLIVLFVSSGCDLACPAALLEGRLTREGSDLVVVRADGYVGRVNWSETRHSVREQGGTLVVVDWLGTVKAREGDYVGIGGGESPSGGWKICGSIDVGEEPTLRPSSLP